MEEKHKFQEMEETEDTVQKMKGLWRKWRTWDYNEESEKPEIIMKNNDQQCLQEEMDGVRNVECKTEKEFPIQIVDSIAKTLLHLHQ